MDNKPVDVAGEVAEVARIALDSVVFTPQPGFTAAFVHEFIHAAGRDMACPARAEDVGHFAEAAAERLLRDPELKDTLVALVRAGLNEYMRSAPSTRSAREGA